MSPRPRFSGLLVSVRTAPEARAAVAGGAAIIDVKEPAAGPLGAASTARAVAVGHAIAGRRPWTLACGELADGPRAAARARRVVAGCGNDVPPPGAAKAGPAGLDLRRWARVFAAFQAEVPPSLEPIAVAYADWRRAAAPEPGRIIAAAAGVGCRTLLIDTFDKRGPSLLDCGIDRVAGWLEAAHARGLAVAVAGRVGLGDLPTLVGLGADVVAVRGCVCRGGRRGRVERRLVASLGRLWVRAVRSRRSHRAAIPCGDDRS